MRLPSRYFLGRMINAERRCRLVYYDTYQCIASSKATFPRLLRNQVFSPNCPLLATQ
jgi:hypothetical protein